MGKEYLVEGAVLMCVNGGECGMLKIPAGHGYTSGGKKKANCTDCIACENIPYFGSCRKNEKDHQCEGFMKLADKWESMAVSVTKPEKVDGEDALTMDSILLCKKGGIIMPLTSGQGYGKGMDMEGFLKRYRNAIRWAAGKNLLCQVFGGDPINMNTGNFIYEKEDLVIFGITQLSFHLFYNSLEEDRGGCLGEGWHHNFELYIRKEEGGRRLSVCMGDGRELPYERTLGNLYVPVFGDGGVLKREDNGYRYSAPSGAPNGVTDGVPSGTEYFFGADGLLLERKDKNGNTDLFTHDGQGRLIKAEGANGGELRYHYNKEGKLICVQDHTGREARLWYRYGKLWKFINAAGQTYTYLYNENGKLESVETPRGIIGVKNTYDAAGRVVKQELPDGGVIEMKYDDETMRTYMKQQNGSMVIHESDGRFRNVKNIYEDGEEVFTYNDRNQKTSYVDKKGNRTRYRYDEKGNLSGIVNALGEVAEFHYNNEHKISSMSIGGKELLKYEYDRSGRLIEFNDALDRKKKIVYNVDGKPAQLIQQDGSTINLTYDFKGNLSGITDSYGGETFYGYDNLNRIISVENTKGEQVFYDYDEMNRLTAITNPEGNIRTISYNQSGKVEVITDFDKNSIHINYNCLNKPDKITDKNGRVTLLRYDKMGHVVEEITPTGAATACRYDRNNRLIRKEVRDSKGNVAMVISYYYDLSGNLLCQEVGDGQNVLSVISYEYDELNRIISYVNSVGGKRIYAYGTSGHVCSITDPAGNQQKFVYNDAGELVEKTDVRGNKTYITHNELGKVKTVSNGEGMVTKYFHMQGGRLYKVVHPDGRQENYTYDSLGRVKSREDKNGYKVSYLYDKMGRITEIIGSTGEKKSYVYDSVGNMISMTDALGNSTLYEYTPEGELSAVTDALKNRTEYVYDSRGLLFSATQRGNSGEEDRSMYYKKNSFGQVECITNVFGEDEYYDYDALGRVLHKIDRDGFRSSHSYTADNKIEKIIYEDGKSIEMEYTPLGQLAIMRDWLGETRIERETAGKPIRITDHAGRKVEYEWGQHGERQGIIYPDGKKVRYLYNNKFQLSGLIREVPGKEQVRISYRYNDNGQLVEKQIQGGIRSLWKYYDTGQIEELVHEDSLGILERFRFQYDANGNKIMSEKERRGIREESGCYRYGYDSLDRLISVDRNGVPLRGYEYDSFGNRTKMQDYDKNMTKYFTYNTLNQLMREELHMADNVAVSTKTYLYDKRGNMLEENTAGTLTHRYMYNAANHLEEAWNENGRTAVYYYNGLGKRIGKNETEYVMDLTKPFNNLLEIREQERIQSFSWDFGAAFVEENGKAMRYYVLDEFGSTLRVSYGTGNGDIYGYDEFGNDLYETEKVRNSHVYSKIGREQPFGYMGYQYDEISGTYFAQAREYRPENGRFSAEDVIRGNGTIPKTLNRYAYCWNNPLQFVDLNGKEPIAAKQLYPVGWGWMELIIEYLEDAQESYNRQREEVPAPEFPSDTTGLPDYTEEIDEWLHGKEEEFQNMQFPSDITYLSIEMQVGLQMGFDIATSIEFYNQVKTGGVMDIKQENIWNEAFGFARPDGYFIYRGEVMDPGTLGNITYGYIGAPMFPESILYLGGGAVNMKRWDLKYVFAIPALPFYGDSPEDHEAVKKGIEMWRNDQQCAN